MTCAEQRARRARAAGTLLSLHDRGELARPELWNWGRIDALPEWTLLDGVSRSGLQRLCGAVLLAPLLRLWIDAEKIRRVSLSVGSQRFARVLDSIPIDIDSEQRYRALTSLDQWLSTACQNDIDECLSGVGACVLCASVSDTWLRGELSATLLAAQWRALHDSLPLPVALAVVHRAVVCTSVDTGPAAVSTPASVAGFHDPEQPVAVAS